MSTQQCCCEPAMPVPPSNRIHRPEAARKHLLWKDTGQWIREASEAVDRLHRWRMLRALMLQRATARRD